MDHILYFLFWTDISCTRFECGRNYLDPRHTVGGEVTKAPWAASIGFHDEDGEYLHQCTGAIISPSVVITAAHCFVTK